MKKYISIFWLVLRCLLVVRKENLTCFSTGLTGQSKNLDSTGNPTGQPTRPVSISAINCIAFFCQFFVFSGLREKSLHQTFFAFSVNLRWGTTRISNQRWSRGHNVRGQRPEKNRRPKLRTDFLRTNPLEAKGRNGRGQGQGPRTQFF